MFVLFYQVVYLSELWNLKLTSFMSTSFQSKMKCTNMTFPINPKRRNKQKKKKNGEMNDQAVVEKKSSFSMPLKWLRLDPDFRWIKTCSFKKPQYMWINQLYFDMDVVAQMDAIMNLRNFPSKKTIIALQITLLNDHLYYKVRIKAAEMMALLSNDANDWAGLDRLYQFYRKQYLYIVDDKDPEKVRVRPNNFENFIDYYLKMGVIRAISMASSRGKTPPDVVDFLMFILDNNDDTWNRFSENYYISNIIDSFRFVKSVRKEKQPELVELIQKFLQVESYMQSYHNTITVSCLKTLVYFMKQGWMDIDRDLFMEYTRYGHYDDVRVAAVECLVRLGITEMCSAGVSVIDYLLGIVAIERYGECVVRMIEKITKPFFTYTLVSKLIIDKEEFEQRFSPLKETNVVTLGLAERIWMMLNSDVTSIDSRVRMALIDIYILMDAKKNVELELETRPVLPTRPPEKKKSKDKRSKKKKSKSSAASSGHAGKEKTETDHEYVPPAEKEIPDKALLDRKHRRKKRKHSSRESKDSKDSRESRESISRRSGTTSETSKRRLSTKHEAPPPKKKRRTTLEQNESEVTYRKTPTAPPRPPKQTPPPKPVPSPVVQPEPTELKKISFNLPGSVMTHFPKLKSLRMTIRDPTSDQVPVKTESHPDPMDIDIKKQQEQDTEDHEFYEESITFPKINFGSLITINNISEQDHL
eukprot:TRINITY_DN4603_c0_g1_i1.p1 TRINITY_DN4603_c0_g1~~TRINITY_DN4603_c0_g1_i1.p1  ORF type:complete len:699 (-),score=151.15 TRINITY_DN4603_c0_g1_i1:33-2129(-)